MLWTGAEWNTGFSSDIIYVRHFSLPVYGASVWFTTGIQAVCGLCRRLLFSQIWSCDPMRSDVVRCRLMLSDAVISHTTRARVTIR